jgi:hypothetical protein
VDVFGRYKGGVPQKEKGLNRGTAWGAPGSLHNTWMHNFKNNPSPDYQFITQEDALAFKFYQKGNDLRRIIRSAHAQEVLVPSHSGL